MSLVYKIGTATVTNGSAIVVGDDTSWQLSAVAGGVFVMDGYSAVIESVESDTSLTLAEPWEQASAIGSYAINRAGDGLFIVDLYDRITQALLTLSLAGIHPDEVGTIAYRDTLVLGSEDKVIFLHAELGEDFEYYVWDGTENESWIGPFPVAASGPAGEPGSAEVVGTSVTSLAIGTGSKVFTVVELNRGWGAGARLRASSDADPTNFMEGLIASYSGSTLTLTVDLIGGAGTHADWTINLAGEPGTGAVASVNGQTGVVVLDAGDIGVTPAGGIAATDVQSALEELDSEKATIAAIRERLTANRTYYVRTDGSDSNTGLVDSAGGAFLTINYAVNRILNTIDFNGFNVVLQIGDGTYPEAILPLGGQVGQGLLTLRGNIVTPANVIVDSPTDGLKIDGVYADAIHMKVEYFEVRAATSRGIWINRQHAKIYIGRGMRFGACAIAHMQSHMGIIEAYQTDYSIVGNSPRHFWGEALGQIWVYDCAVTLVGTPAFGTNDTEGFAVAQKNSYLRCNSIDVIFTGAATGRRYWFDNNATIDTTNGGENYFPGNASGIKKSGAVHDGIVGGQREQLTADRTYYVRSDGSDSNTGLANTSGSAFLTIAKAIEVVSALDISIYNVTIQVQDGTWTVPVVVSAPWIGSGTVTLQGNTGTPASCTLNVTGAPVTVQNAGSRLTISGLTIVGTTFGVYGFNGGSVTIGAGVVFGACTVAHMRAFGPASLVTAEAQAYTITGGAASHLLAGGFGQVSVFGAAITLTGTPAFTQFANADRLGLLNFGSAVITGSATGKRYSVTNNGLCHTGTGNVNFLPGNAAGTVDGPGSLYT